MTKNNWLKAFDTELKQRFGIDHSDAGMDEVQIARYRDLDPQDAAHAFGEDYDLDRIDGPWGG